MVQAITDDSRVEVLLLLYTNARGGGGGVDRDYTSRKEADHNSIAIFYGSFVDATACGVRLFAIFFNSPNT